MIQKIYPNGADSEETSVSKVNKLQVDTEETAVSMPNKLQVDTEETQASLYIEENTTEITTEER